MPRSSLRHISFDTPSMTHIFFEWRKKTFSEKMEEKYKIVEEEWKQHMWQNYHPTHVYSRSLTDAEKRRSTLERELLGLKTALCKLEKWYKGYSILVGVDHKNLTNLDVLLANRSTSAKMERWILVIKRFLYCWC